MKFKTIGSLVVLCGGIGLASAAHATSYSSDPALNDFLTGDGSYATFTNYANGDEPLGGWTPNDAELQRDPRVFSWTSPAVAGLGAGNWILATFGTPQDQIRVFPNIDHLGASYDGYQYSIWGQNADSSWTELYDPLSVAGSGEPFTIGSAFGTAPTNVNNVLTPGSSLSQYGGGTIGYIADFLFSNSYSVFAFGTSTAATDLNDEQELSAVGALSNSVSDCPTCQVPEPLSLSIFGAGLAGVAVLRRRKKRAV